MTMQVMAASARNRVQVQITDEDQEVLDRLQAAVPILRDFSKAALLLYLARKGIERLAADPLAVFASPPETPELLEQIARAKSTVASVRLMEAPTPPPQKRPTTAERTAAGLDATGSSKSLNEVRGHLEALREEKREREEGEAQIVRLPPVLRGPPRRVLRGLRRGHSSEPRDPVRPPRVRSPPPR